MKLVIPIQYDHITYNSEYNAFKVTLDKSNALIDLENNILIPFCSDNLLG